MNVNVKTMLKLGTVTVMLMVAGAAKSHAATTNQVQKVAIDLTYYEQGPTNSTNGLSFVEKVRVKTSDIIAALGTATSNSFSDFARLEVVTDTTSSNSTSVIEVVDGTNTVNVTGYFSSSNSTLSVTGDFLPRGWEGEDNARHHRNTTVSGTITYDILYLTFGGANTKATFDVNGLDISTSTTNGLGVGLNQTSALVSGTGTDSDGNAAIVSGTISVSDANAEPGSDD